MSNNLNREISSWSFFYIPNKTGWYLNYTNFVFRAGSVCVCLCMYLCIFVCWCACACILIVDHQVLRWYHSTFEISCNGIYHCLGGQPPAAQGSKGIHWVATHYDFLSGGLREMSLTFSWLSLYSSLVFFVCSIFCFLISIQKYIFCLSWCFSSPSNSLMFVSQFFHSWRFPYNSIFILDISLLVLFILSLTASVPQQKFLRQYRNYNVVTFYFSSEWL